jgi:four helix bundle protein
VQDDQAVILSSNPYANIPVSARTSHGFFTISLDIHGIIKQFSLSAIQPISIWLVEVYMRNFREIGAWHKGHELTLNIYKATQDFPKEELYGLTSQMRRSAASIPANIAEGCGKDSDVELARYMQIAMGSARELEYHLLLAKDLNFMDMAAYNQLNTATIEVKKMLASFIKRIRDDNQQRRK